MATKAIKLRVPEERLAAIDRAAAWRGQSRTEFLVECGYREAVSTMHDRPIIQLNDQAYDDLVTYLEAPARPNGRLTSLLERPSPWD